MVDRNKRARRHWDALGLAYPQNGFRHSFATYHIAWLRDAGKTDLLLTHRGGARVLWDSYYGIATQNEGEAYFQINPPA